MEITEKLSDSISGLIDIVLASHREKENDIREKDLRVGIVEDTLAIYEKMFSGIKEILATPEIEVGNDADGIRQRKLEAISKILEG